MERARQFAQPGTSRLLGVLPGEVRLAVESRCERVALGVKDVLYEPDTPIEHVYFPLTGVLSVVIQMSDGGVVEVATIGNEGMAGIAAFLGSERSPMRVFSQIAGDAYKMPVDQFRRALEEHPALYRLVQRYTQALLTQISQSAACNRLHSIQERACCWLLMTHDRVGADEFDLTREFLSQMLGVRIASVAVVAGMLQQAGLIDYRRGRIKVLNRQGLEEGACECYEIVRKEFERLLSHSQMRGS